MPDTINSDDGMQLYYEVSWTGEPGPILKHYGRKE